MNHRDHIIYTVQKLIENEQQLFTNLINISMTGELSHMANAFDEDDIYTFKLELFETLDDPNVKEIVALVKHLQQKTNDLIHFNQITDTELDYNYDWEN